MEVLLHLNKIALWSATSELRKNFFFLTEFRHINLNVSWHIISDPRVRDFFFPMKKSQKYANFKMLKNASPELNLEYDKMGHLIFMGLTDSKLFSLPYWQEMPFSAPFQ